MDSNMGRAGFQIGIFIMLVSGGLLFVVERGTAEYAISLITFLIGLIFLLGIVIVVRWSQRQ